MPWEKSFCTEEVLERAAVVFWAKGYEGATMSDLIKGMGINKGSLYNAFGCKKELFKRVLTRFNREHQRPNLQQLENLDDPVLAITTLFDVVITQGVTDTEKKGCLIINTALEIPNHDEDVGDIVRAVIDELEQFFLRMIQLGQARSTISSDLNPTQTAKSLVSMLVGIRVLSRGAFDAAGLLAVKHSALRLIEA